MCGIAGYVGPPRDVAVDRLLRALAPRGPDGEGVVHARGPAWRAVLCHRRLAIIDPTPGGAQPMLLGRRHAITFNGEIFNHAELRANLERDGEVFRTRSDTEVLLRGLARRGPRFVEALRGPFALACLDRVTGEVVLARDRLGVAPLYVSSVPGGGVAFASTTWALEEAGLTSGELWLRGLCGFLFYGSVPEPLTLTRGLEELPPATWARLGPAGEVERRVFWRFPPEEGGHVPAGEAARRVREALADAVRAEQVSDVPVAVLLSSGLDSTAVAALAAQSALGPPQTFTVGIDDEGPGAVDESGMAAETARSLGLPHATVRADVRGGGEALRQALAAQDLPSVDGTNTYLVSRAIRGAGYKVALSGLGGDELFLGYVNRVNYRRLEGWEAPWWLARWGQAAVTALGRLGLPARVERALAAGLSPRGPLGAYAAIRTIRAPGGVARALHPDLRASLEPEDLDATSYLDGAGLPADPDGALSRLELKHYLRWTLLKDSNQLSLCSGLELRVPLVDARLVEVVLSLPGRVRAQGPPPKPLLRAALAGVLPPGIERRPKRGFVLPLGRWLEGAPDLEDTTREGGLLDARAPRGDLPARLSRAALKAWRARTRWVQGTGCAVM